MTDDEAARLEATERAFRAIVDHAREGGSFRYLIYDRLGFGPEAYQPLYLAGGMVISNEFELSDEPWAAAVAAERERCAEVAAEFTSHLIGAVAHDGLQAVEARRLVDEIRQQISQPPATDHDNSQRADADAADEAGEADRLRDAHSG